MEYSLDPLMKAPNRPYTEPSHPPGTDVEQVSMCHQAKVGLKGGHQGRAHALSVPAPRWVTLSLILLGCFVLSPRLGPW
jgi:hypothetical protein